MPRPRFVNVAIPAFVLLALIGISLVLLATTGTLTLPGGQPYPAPVAGEPVPSPAGVSPTVPSGTGPSARLPMVVVTAVPYPGPGTGLPVPPVTVTPTKPITFEMHVDVDPVRVGELVSANGARTVRFPAGAQKTAFRARLASPTTAGAQDEQLPMSFLDRFVVEAFAPTDRSRQFQQFLKALTLTVTYDPLFYSGERENSLTFVYWDPRAKEWQLLPTVIDRARHTVTAQTTHLSEFGVTNAPDLQQLLPKLLGSEPDRFVGAATFDYPLTVPPGRGGLTPP